MASGPTPSPVSVASETMLCVHWAVDVAQYDCGYDYDCGPEGKWRVYDVSRVGVCWVTGTTFTATAEEVGQALHVEMNIIRKAIIFEPVHLCVAECSTRFMCHEPGEASQGKSDLLHSHQTTNMLQLVFKH